MSRIEDKFLSAVSKNYEELKTGHKTYCFEKNLDYSEDVFGDSIVKCYDAIKKKGRLLDESEKGLKNYLYRACQINTIRSKQYASCYKRDNNVINVGEKYETWFNESKMTVEEKLKSDIYKDFATLFIMSKVENHFDGEHFMLFKMKYLIPDMTYKKLAEKTGVKGVRNKVIEVKTWVKENITKDEIKKALEEEYGELFN